MNNINRFIVLTLFIFALSSCTNQEEIVNPNKSIMDISPISTYEKLSDLYKNLDADILNSNDKNIIIPYLEQKNIEVKNYLVTNYPQYSDLAHVDKKDLTIFYLGLIHAMAEENGFNVDNFDSSKEIPQWVECVFKILSEYISVKTLYKEVVSLVTEGASFEAVWPIIRKTLKRYVVWYAVARIGYDIITECVI